MECPENGKVVCPVFGGIKCPAISRSKFVFYTCRPDAYTINIAPDGSVLSENPKDGDLQCFDMLTRSVVPDGIFHGIKKAAAIVPNSLYESTKISSDGSIRYWSLQKEIFRTPFPNSIRSWLLIFLRYFGVKSSNQISLSQR